MLSDSDDDIHIVNVVSSARKAFAASPAVQQIDSDDDQPLELLKSGLKQALTSSQPSTEAAPSAPQQSQPAKSKAVKKLVSKKTAAAGVATSQGDFGVEIQDDHTVQPYSFHSRTSDKENLNTAAASADVEAVDCDLDNWNLQPLQRRTKRRAKAASAAVSGSPDKPASCLDEALQEPHQQAEAWQSQHQQRQQQIPTSTSQPHEQQQQHHQHEWHRQDRQHGDPLAADTAAAASKPKRQRRTATELQSDFDYQHADDPDDPVHAPSAAAGGSKQRGASRGSSKAAGATSTGSGRARTTPAAALDADDDYQPMEYHSDDPSFEAPAANGSGKARGGSRKAAAGASSGSSRVRMTAEERAAKKAEEKARKEAEKIAAKLAKQAEAEAVKAAKRFETFNARKLNGGFQEYESVLVMDTATSATALGLAISAELDRRKTIAWQVVDTLPLSRRWPGCTCFSFKRRKLCDKDEHNLKTATSSRLDSFVEDVAPPYVQLVFQEASSFVEELLRDRLAGVFTAVRAAHMDCTLGVIALGLKSYVQRLDNQQMRQGGVSRLDWRRANSMLLQLHLSTPGLQLRLLTKQEEVATHLINTARVIGQQPYSVENQLEACGGAGPGAASKAAAAAMAEDLTYATKDFAVNTLGKMHGMGGNKAWAVAKAYPSFGALIAGFQRASAPPGGAPALLLADLLEPGNKAKARRVGPAMSKRLHLLLTCEDPDVIVEGEGDAAGD